MILYYIFYYYLCIILLFLLYFSIIKSVKYETNLHFYRKNTEIIMLVSCCYYRVFWMVLYRLNSKELCLRFLVFDLFCPPQKFIWVPDIDMTWNKGPGWQKNSLKTAVYIISDRIEEGVLAEVPPRQIALKLRVGQQMGSQTERSIKSCWDSRNQ